MNDDDELFRKVWRLLLLAWLLGTFQGFLLCLFLYA